MLTHTKNTRHGKRTDTCTTNVTLKCPAKLNLGLRIVGRRADGYHCLQSLFWPIDLADHMELKTSNLATVSVEWAQGLGAVCIPTEQNLAFRALSTLEPSPKIAIKIKKNIPSGAGLGGGSSNAGTLLKYFLSDPNYTLTAQPETLGADVPFFLRSTPSWVTGIGERVTPLPFARECTSELFFVLAIPHVHVATARVFQAYRERQISFSSEAVCPLQIGDSLSSFSEWLRLQQNDLETITCELYPSIEKYISALRTIPHLYSGVSGTGSTCFAVIHKRDVHTAEKVLTRLISKECSGSIHQSNIS